MAPILRLLVSSIGHDIPLLISRLLVGEIQSHILKQATIGGRLERVGDWLARRRLIEQDLKSAYLMIGKLQDAIRLRGRIKGADQFCSWRVDP